MPEVDDEIIETTISNKTYVVVEIPYIDWDIDVPVLVTTILREIPYEA
jgi:hypothetical protein